MSIISQNWKEKNTKSKQTRSLVPKDELVNPLLNGADFKNYFGNNSSGFTIRTALRDAGSDSVQECLPGPGQHAAFQVSLV